MQRFDDIPAMMLVADLESQSVILNKAARSFLGYTPDDKLGLMDLVLADVPAEARSSSQSMLENNMTVQATRRLVSKDRDIVEVTGTVWPGWRDGAKVLYAVFKPTVQKTPETLVQEALVYISTVCHNGGSDSDPLLDQVFRYVDWRHMSNTLAQLIGTIIGRWGADVDEDGFVLFQELCADIAMIESPAI